MRSIRKALTRRISIAISLLIIFALVVTDLAVDEWVEQQFNNAIKDKIGLLETLVDEDLRGVEFEFADEFFPEFEGEDDAEYFQLWYQGEVFEKSHSLALHGIQSLPFKTTAEHEVLLEDTVLPDGRDGRIAYITFEPQIDGDERAAFFARYGDKPRDKMTVAYAVSVESLQYSLWLIDGSFIVALLLVPVFVRLVVTRTVAYSLEPLDELIQQLRSLKVSEKASPLSMYRPIEELQPIVDSVNHFLLENSRLYERERRLTSDIAHELKTPVTELLTLTEIAIKFPGEEAIESSYKPEVLAITQRMKSIISGLMVLHKYSHQPLDCSERIDLEGLINKVAGVIGNERINCDVAAGGGTTINSNLFALESVFTNLLTNAVSHSPADSRVRCIIAPGANATTVSITNTLAHPLSDDDLSQMFEPLWQLDAARTSAENFGLGLSIVKVLLQAVQGTITVNQQDGQITFNVSLPENG